MTKCIDLMTLGTSFTELETHLDPESFIDFIEELVIDSDDEYVKHEYYDISITLDQNKELKEEEKFTKGYIHRLIGEDTVFNSDCFYIFVFFPDHYENENKEDIKVQILMGILKGCLKYIGQEINEEELGEKVEVMESDLTICLKVKDYDKSFFDSIFTEYLN